MMEAVVQGCALRSLRGVGCVGADAYGDDVCIAALRRNTVAGACRPGGYVDERDPETIDPSMSVAYGGHNVNCNDDVASAFTHVLVVPDPENVVCGCDSVVGETLGPEHLRAVNLIADVSECWSVVSEGGAGVAVALLGTVVALHVSTRVGEGGGCTTVLMNSHGVLADVSGDPSL